MKTPTKFITDLSAQEIEQLIEKHQHHPMPSYCLELNKIEMLWQKIKYDWLTWKANKSEKSLRAALDEVLAGIGSKYEIIFR